MEPAPTETVPTVDQALNPSAADLPAPDPDLMVRADRRAKVAVGAEVVYAAWLVALFAGGVLGVALPSDDLVTGIDIAASLATLVVFLMWKYSAYTAAMQLSPEPLDSTPGWAVGGYFIPFANLWLPFARMREIQRTAEVDPLGLDVDPGRSRALIVVWWIAWVVTPIFTRVLEAADPAGESVAWIAAFVVTLAAALLTALVAFRMNEEQQAQAAAREADAPVALFG